LEIQKNVVSLRPREALTFFFSFEGFPFYFSCVCSFCSKLIFKEKIIKRRRKRVDQIQDLEGIKLIETERERREREKVKGEVETEKNKKKNSPPKKKRKS